MSKLTLVGNAVAGSMLGVLTRPCCVLPVAMSTLGLSTAVVGPFVSDYRPWLLAGSAALLISSVVITLRREGGTAAKAITVAMSVAAFVITRVWTGVY